MRLKFDQTPVTPERFQEISQDAALFMQMLQTPIAPTKVYQLQKKQLVCVDFIHRTSAYFVLLDTFAPPVIRLAHIQTEKEQDLTYYIQRKGDTIKSYTSWIRGICILPGGYEKALGCIDMLKVRFRLVFPAFFLFPHVLGSELARKSQVLVRHCHLQQSAHGPGGSAVRIYQEREGSCVWNDRKTCV